MKILDSIRSLAGNRFTRRDPGEGGTIITGDGHTHNNLGLLQQLTDNPTHRFLKINNAPTETALLEEEW